MNRYFSVYLDAVRFLAAMVVFASHFVYLRWTGGVFPERIVNWVFHSGTDAVMVFFVLSGFVIAYTVDVKDKTWGAYAFSRATRIYSVVLPALLLTFLLDRVGSAMNPSDYDGWWYVQHSFIEFMFRGLTFSNEFWTEEFRIGSNGPYWSLGYEIWFYVLFGVLAFAKGWLRWALFGAAFLLVGPRVWLLAPVWIMGLVLYRVFRQGRLDRQEGSPALAAAIFMALAPLLCYAALRLSSANEFLDSVSAQSLAGWGEGAFGYSTNYLWSWTVGLLVTVHFLGMGAALQNVVKGKSHKLSKQIETPVRWLAGASFSIYLVHYPIMQAFDAVLVGETASSLRALILLCVTLGGCLVFAALFERTLPAIRCAIKRIGGFDRRASKECPQAGTAADAHKTS